MGQRPNTQPLLVSRDEACRMLGGVHKSTLVRLEADKKLTPVKLRGPLSNTFYRHEQVVALAQAQTNRGRVHA